MERKWCGGRGWRGAEQSHLLSLLCGAHLYSQLLGKGCGGERIMGLKPVWATEWDPAPESKKKRKAKGDGLRIRELAAKPRDMSSIPRPLMVKGELSTYALAVPCMCTHRK